MDILNAYRQALGLEVAALQGLVEKSDEGVARAVEILHGCQGKIVIIGMGKCGYIGQKMAATFVSTGTMACFLHPSEALHGDLGLVATDDVALLLSNSGQTDEITAILPHLKRLGVKRVALTGYSDSILANESNVVIDTGVTREADPLNLAPTASTTAMLAVGDALAAVLMALKGFVKKDYAVFHPGGSLGQRLLCRVHEVMHSGDDLPLVAGDTPLRDALLIMTSKRLGTLFVLNDAGKLSGIVTDGDLRRLFQREAQPFDLPMADVMNSSPKTIDQDALAAEALLLMEEKPLKTILAVTNDSGTLVGALHIHDLIRIGLQSGYNE
jgi:arabinose-5-phosphate isomerase